jgi:cathepsin E
MFPATLLTTLLLALSVAANPIVQFRNSPITLPVSRRINATSIHNILQQDQNRVKTLKARAKALQGGVLSPEEAAIVNEPVDNQAVSYLASVGVGTPATTCALHVWSWYPVLLSSILQINLSLIPEGSTHRLPIESFY